MNQVVKGAWSICGTFGVAYLTVVGVAAQLEKPQPWFAYWWHMWLLVIAALAGAVALLLLMFKGLATLVRHIRVRKKAKFEEAVNKEVERRAPPAKPTAHVAVPGSYKYPRGNVLENIHDRSLSYKWRNGIPAAKAIPEGQGYRVHDIEGNEIGYARDRDSIAALVEDHFPEV